MIYRNNKNKDTYSLSLVGEFVSCLGIRNVPRESREKYRKLLRSVKFSINLQNYPKVFRMLTTIFKNLGKSSETVQQSTVFSENSYSSLYN